MKHYFTCPRCGNEWELEAPDKMTPPIMGYCKECYNERQTSVRDATRISVERVYCQCHADA